MRTRLACTWFVAALAVSTLALYADTGAEEQAAVGEAGRWLSTQDAHDVTNGFARHHGGVRSHLYAAARVRKVLAARDTVGLRLWFGNDAGSPAFVLVGVDGQGRDQALGPWLDDAEECPPHCPSTQLAPPLDASKAGRMISRQRAGELTHHDGYTVDGVGGYLFAAEKVRALLDQPGAAGLRVHYGRMHGTDPVHPVLVATDRRGVDLEAVYLGQGRPSFRCLLSAQPDPGTRHSPGRPVCEGPGAP